MYYLKKEIRSDEKRLFDLKYACRNYDDNNVNAEIAMLESTISNKKERCIVYYNQIIQYIAGIDDSLLRMIITLRHVDMMKWRDIAQKLGGGNTEDGIRKIYMRYLEKESKKDKTGTAT